MDLERLKGLVRDFYQARLTNNLETFQAQFAPGAEVSLSGAKSASSIAASAPRDLPVEDYLDDLVDCWRWIEQDILDLVAEDDRVAVYYRLKTEHNETGAVFDTDLCDLISFNDAGLVVRFIAFVDTATVARLDREAQGGASA